MSVELLSRGHGVWWLLSFRNCGNIPSLYRRKGPSGVAGPERRRREVGSGPRIVSPTGFGDLAHGLRGLVALYQTTTLFEDLCLSQAHRVGVVGERGCQEEEFVSVDLLAVENLED